MARAIWTGVISFGLVSVPVGLYTATSEHDIRFHQFEKGTSDRIRYKRVNERTGKEVPYENIVKGAEVEGGDYVILDRNELEEIAPGRSRLMSIDRFVDLDEIDPLFFQKSYFLAPTDDTTARTYALLRQAMANTNRAAVASFVMRGKQYLCAVRADGDVLTLEAMYFADEVRDPHEQLDTLPRNEHFRAAELRMAENLIETMAGPWEPDAYSDTFTEKVQELIEAKRSGGQLVSESEPPAATDVVDLMAALRQSVQAAKAGRRSGFAARPSAKPAEHAASRDARGAADNLAGTTKAQLEKLARKYDISGRSKMNKSELMEAVRSAQAAATTQAS